MKADCPKKIIELLILIGLVSVPQNRLNSKFLMLLGCMAWLIQSTLSESMKNKFFWFSEK